MCKHLREVPDKYYEHVPDKIININKTASMWDVPILTDQMILANRPDTVFHNKWERTCRLTYIAIPDDASVMLKETENSLQKQGSGDKQDEPQAKSGAGQSGSTRNTQEGIWQQPSDPPRSYVSRWNVEDFTHGQYAYP